MTETAIKALADERVCFVCQGTGSLPWEKRGLRSILDTMQSSHQYSAPKNDETYLGKLSKLESDKIRLEKQKKALLKTVERIQNQQNIIEQKMEQIQYKSDGQPPPSPDMSMGNKTARGKLHKLYVNMFARRA
ncbi:MAG TPA: hypothetical protein ACFYD6_11215 [Candidatus Brocadiia bacterium]|nr:hypothetical protein [Planctomycetota bacterium]MDO8092993.1 hypothetical protein [Candidatus Brocadiales bacterium]